MGMKAAISEEEYLHTSFPGVDCEYRDGELVERALPDTFHAETQPKLGGFFSPFRKKLSVFAYSELRMKVRDRVYLIPDISVFWPSRPKSVPDTPPLVTVEILSPDDRLAAVLEKLQEYRAWGVGHVWLVNPYSRGLSPAIQA